MRELEEYLPPSGSGPGNQTPDGCSVELYKHTPYRGELEIFTERLRNRSVLELGCGTGRLTTRLIQLGCKVTAVDNSPDMLSELPPSAHKILSDIESLTLDHHFEVVLLASFIFNHPDVRVRQSMAATAQQHLENGQPFIIQVHPENMLSALKGNTSEADGIVTRIENIKKNGNLVSASMQYRLGEQEWSHTFQALVLNFDQLVDELLHAGFSQVEWIDEAKGWLCAT